MTPSHPILCLDLGAAGLKWAEFCTDETGSLQLLRYGLGSGPALESLAGAVQGKRHCSVCAPGGDVLSKFLSLPATDSHRLRQLLAFEVRQHFPIPSEELTWDYQPLEPAGSGHSQVLVAAVKTSAATEWVQAAERLGCRVDVLDVAPVALANAFRYSYSDQPGCSLLLDIGARSTNIVLLEAGRFFYRTLNLGGNTLTAEFAREAGLPWPAAEQQKVAEGMVGLGGAFEEPAAPVQALLAKVTRQFMTRLHTQVAQTVQFYRSHHGGSLPGRLYLAGAGAALPYTAEFFAEKLSMPATYFNPFRRVRLDPAIPIEPFARIAPALGPLVGLALRTPMRVPVELNLIPSGVLQRREQRRVTAFSAATAVTLAAALVLGGWCFHRLAAEKQRTYEAKQKLVERLQQREQRFKAALAERDRSARVAEQLTRWMTGRFYWADFLVSLRQVLEATEAATSQGPRRSGIWIESMSADLPDEPAPEETPVRPPMDPRLWWRYFGSMVGRPPADGFPPPPASLPQPAANQAGVQPSQAATNQINAIRLTCRAVSWKRLSPTADSEIAYAFLKHLQASPFAASGPDGTRLAGLMEKDDATGTFTFDARLMLKTPIQIGL